MKTVGRLALVASACVLSAAGAARASEFLGGMESGQFKTDLVRTDAVATEEYSAHHSSSAATVEWVASDNLSVYLGVGHLASRREEFDPATSSLDSQGTDGGIIFSVGAAVQADFEDRGSLLLDFSYSHGWLDWDDAGTLKEYDHDRTSALVGYAFGRPDKARLYTGFSYNTYTSELLNNGANAGTFENDQRFSLLVGVRAKAPTFTGFMEARAIGELGVRMGLAFGF